MYYIGVDPGSTGGIAAVDELGHVAFASKMPATESEVLSILKDYPDSRAVLEQVRSSPQMGVVSAFTFGRNYGMLRMGLSAAGIPYDEVMPRRWQTTLRCLSGGDKNVTKRRAQELFPTVKITHAIADALLLAEYARRTAIPLTR